MQVPTDPKDVERWIKDIADMVTHSHLRGTCAMTGQIRMVDVSSQTQTSLTPFASTNPVFMMLVITWITSSFSLFYVRSPDLIPDENGKWEMMRKLMVGVLAIWHIAIIVIILLPAMYSDKNIPMNNMIISIILVGVSAILQLKYYDKKSAKREAKDSLKAAGIPDEQITNLLHGMQGTVRARSPFTISGKNSRPAEPLGLVFMGDDEKRGAKKTLEKYLVHPEEQLDTNTLRFAEYAITTPPLVVVVLASVSPSTSTTALLITYISTAGFYLICMAATKFAVAIQRLEQKKEKNTEDENEKVKWRVTWQGGAVMIIIILLSAATMAYVLVQYGILAGFQGQVADPKIQVATYLVVVAQCVIALTVVISFIMQIRGMWNFEDTTQKAMILLVYSFINGLIKFIIPILVVLASLDNNLPTQNCYMWADMQGKFDHIEF